MPAAAHRRPAPSKLTDCPAPEWTEQTLLARVLDGENTAWAELVRRYRALIYRCITKVTMRHSPGLGGADLDEIFAEVLMNLLSRNMCKLRMFNPERGTKLSSWLGMISINTAYDFLRAAGRRPLLDRIDGCPEPEVHPLERSPLERLIEKERWDHLNALLTEFSAKDRTFLDLYYAEGLDPESIANRMKISLKTVYSKKHKIRAHLQRCLALRAASPIADLAAA